MNKMSVWSFTCDGRVLHCDLSECWLILTPRHLRDICPPRCPSEPDALPFLYILTAYLWKWKMFAGVCFRARAWVCVYSTHRCCDGRWRVSGCGWARVICLAEHGAVNGPAPGSDMCNIVTSELVCCPIWPVWRGHISDEPSVSHLRPSDEVKGETSSLSHADILIKKCCHI